jgi:hypothetical protein
MKKNSNLSPQRHRDTEKVKGKLNEAFLGFCFVFLCVSVSLW